MYRYPAEWEPQDGIMLTWPHPETDWLPVLDQVEPVFVDIARHTSRFEKVIISCHNQAHCEHVQQLLETADLNMANCHLYICPSNDSWVRDHGPVTILDHGKPQLLDFTFNGWGNKYPAPLDNRVTQTLYGQGVFNQTPISTLSFVLEGGSLETDGQGTLLTTTSCLLSPQRNPDMDQADIDATLCNSLGVNRVLWLYHGHMLGDDTDGHIDTLARFIDPDTIMYVSCDDATYPGQSSLQQMENELQALNKTDGTPYRLIPLPFANIRNEQGDYLPASYANFLIINGAVLVPLYDVEADQAVIELFNKHFVDREVIGINCRPLVQQFGSLHCVTMHIPEGVIHDK